ncbi:MAG: DUF2867 domain-containing protein, partial [bacterium]
WCDALSTLGAAPACGGVRFGSRLVDSRSIAVDCSREQAFAPIRKIGGDAGWYSLNWLWRFRGYLDLLAGGPGLRRGRRNPKEVTPGDAIDFWRVEAVEPGSLLRLQAEMKLPGRAWLQFEVEDTGQNRSTIRQTAIFDPVGLAGLAYWYALYPAHALVFAGMLRGIARRAVVQNGPETTRMA